MHEPTKYALRILVNLASLRHISSLHLIILARSYDTEGHPRPIGWPPGRANDSWLIICFWQADGKTIMAAIKRELKTHGPNYTAPEREREREREGDH